MSTTIPVHYVESFSSNVRFLSQQKMSKLRSTVIAESGHGEAMAIERIGSASLTANTITQSNDRHGDTPLNNTPHSRRWVYPSFFDYADMIDTVDKVQILAQPENKYMMQHAAIMGRQIDLTIISALNASVKEGQSAETTTAFPGTQQVGDTVQDGTGTAATGLNLAKMLQAKQMLDAADVDEMYPRFLIVSAEEVTDLLKLPEIKSIDYNTQKSLAEGRVTSYMGFHIVRCERLAKTSNTRKIFAYAAPAMCLKTWIEPNTEANLRPDKRNSTQLYTQMGIGAVRVEDEMVVEIACTYASA